MLKYESFIPVFLLKFCLFLSSTAACQQAVENWALNDLVFAKDTILENHPGIYNELDPDFCMHLESFFNEAKTRLAQAPDDNECKAILHTFGKSFNDIHLRIVFSEKKQSSASAKIEEQSKKAQFFCDISDTLCYIKIPTFYPLEEEIQKMNLIVETMKGIRNIPYIVFDISGNGGGSSVWSKQIVDALFGEGYTVHKRERELKKQYTEWRASSSNLNYLKTDVKLLITEQFGKESDTAKWVDSIIVDVQKAYNAGEPLCRLSSSSHCVDIKNIIEEDSLCSSTIIVLMDDRCASASLGFIDELKLMANKIVLIGKQTMADSLYMECRSVELPSKRGRVTIPIKVYRNRPRGHNVPYTPDIEYEGDMSDTQTLQKYIAVLMHKQLGAVYE